MYTEHNGLEGIGYRISVRRLAGQTLAIIKRRGVVVTVGRGASVRQATVEAHRNWRLGRPRKQLNDRTPRTAVERESPRSYSQPGRDD